MLEVVLDQLSKAMETTAVDVAEAEEVCTFKRLLSFKAIAFHWCV